MILAPLRTIIGGMHEDRPMDRKEQADGNAANVAALLALPKPQRFLELARSYAEAQGHATNGAGRIVADQCVVAHGWSGYAKRFRTQILDWIVGEVSQFGGFQALLDAENGYYPTMRIDHDWRMLPLADAYDAAQEERADQRRSYRAMPSGDPADQPDRDDDPENVSPRP